MNHRIFASALSLLGALLLSPLAHAETEDIPLPGDYQTAPAKSAHKPTKHKAATETTSPAPSTKHRKGAKSAGKHQAAAGKKSKVPHARKPASKARAKQASKGPGKHTVGKKSHQNKPVAKKHKKQQKK